MIRATTPTFKFNLPFECSTIDSAEITFTQRKKLILVKKLEDCELLGCSLLLTLTEQETLLFDCDKRDAQAQLHVSAGGLSLATKHLTFKVDPIDKETCFLGG